MDNPPRWWNPGGLLGIDLQVTEQQYRDVRAALKRAERGGEVKFRGISSTSEGEYYDLTIHVERQHLAKVATIVQATLYGEE